MGTLVPVRYKDTSETVLEVYVKQAYATEVRMVLNYLFRCVGFPSIFLKEMLVQCH